MFEEVITTFIIHSIVSVYFMLLQMTELQVLLGVIKKIIVFSEQHRSLSLHK